MPFFLNQSNPYTPPFVDASLTADIGLQATINPDIYSKYFDISLVAETGLDATINPYFPFDVGFVAETRLNATINVEIVTKYVDASFVSETGFEATINVDLPLKLVEPAPIINEISATAFQAKSYRFRLRKNTQELKIKGFTINAPSGSFGKTVDLELVTSELSKVDKNAKNYKFEIGTGNSIYDAPIWTTILDNGALNNRSYGLKWLNDRLSFGVIESINDRLNRYPKANLVFYDSAKVDFTQDTEILYDTNGNAFVTNTQDITGLNLYFLFHQAFIAGAGFANFITNIPNFEVPRADFLVTSSYLDAIKGFVGLFEPIFYTVGNTLYILDSTQKLPNGFTATAIQPNNYLSWTQTIESAKLIDGLLITFQESNNNANYFTNNLIQSTDTQGSFGSADFVETRTTKTIREWRNTANPNTILKTDITSETRTVYSGANSELTSRDTESYSYDSQGKLINATKKSEKLLPDLPNKDLLLQTVRNEEKTYFYTTDRFNPRRQIQSKIVTRISGKIAVDAENKYLDEDFRQDFIDAHRAGNLSEGMTLEDGALKTIIETFDQVANGQTQRRVEGFDQVRNVPITATPEVFFADNSLSSQTAKSKQVVLFKTAMTPSLRDGNPLEDLNLGVLPFQLGLPLATRILAQKEARKESGTIEILGFDKSIERGSLLAVKNRSGVVIGNFMILGFIVSGTDLGTANARISTQLQVQEV